MLDKRSVSEAVGEYATLAELLRRGFVVFLPHGRTQPDWDLLVHLADGTQVKVQVKAIAHQSAAHLDVDNIQFDILIIVDTRMSQKDSTAPMRFFVLQAHEVSAVCSPENVMKKEKSSQRHISIPKNPSTNPVLVTAQSAWWKIGAVKRAAPV